MAATGDAVMPEQMYDQLQTWSQAFTQFSKISDIPNLLEQKASTSEECTETWRLMVEQMLDAVSASFPECKGTTQCLALFRNVVSKNEAYLRECIKSWYAEVSIFVPTFLKSYAADPNLDRLIEVCSGVRSRSKSEQSEPLNIGSLMMTLLTSSESKKKQVLKDLVHPTTILNIIDLESKWTDPDLTSESKMYLTQYFIIITGYSIIHHLHESKFLTECQSLLSAIQSESKESTTSLGVVFVQTLSEQMKLGWFIAGMSKFDAAIRCIQIEKSSGILTAPSTQKLTTAVVESSVRHQKQESAESAPAAGPIDFSMFANLDDDGTKQKLHELSSELGFDSSKLITDENISKFQKAFKTIPPDFIQKMATAFQSGNMGALMDPANFQILAQACESSDISMADMMSNVDMPALIESAQKMPMIRDNPVAKQLLTAVATGGATNIAGLMANSGGSSNRPSSGTAEDKFVLPDFD